MGRPDLLERAANIQGTMEQGARTLYRSIQAFKCYEEWLQIWPGHGAGSSCGKGISAVPHSTLGYERRFNWAFKAASEDAFVENVLAGQPDPPKAIRNDEAIEQGGTTGACGIQHAARLDDQHFATILDRGGLVVDTRSAADYAAGFVPGSLNLPDVQLRDLGRMAGALHRRHSFGRRRWR